MTKIVMDHVAYKALTEHQNENLHQCTSLRLGTPVLEYRSYKPDGTPVGRPLTAMWLHPKLSVYDLALVGLVAADTARLRLRTRGGANKPDPVDRDGVPVRREREDIMFAVGLLHKAELDALETVLGGEDVDAVAEAIKLGSAAVDDGRRVR